MKEPTNPTSAAAPDAAAPASLSIVIPVYNERATIAGILKRVRAVTLPGGLIRQIVVVDDCSTDGTSELLAEMARPDHPDNSADLLILRQEINQGKGAAVRRGFAESSGDLLLVQDADLEYDPAEYPRLLAPILEGAADVVFGTRFGGESHRVLYYWHSVANHILTTLSNMLTNLNLTDMECCYKVFKRSVIQRIKLTENRFGFEPEVVARVARLDVRVYEVSVSYHGRSYAEGKKITWKDGLSAIRAIFRHNLLP